MTAIMTLHREATGKSKLTFYQGNNGVFSEVKSSLDV